VYRTQNLCPQQMLRARANGETFMSATMCLQQFARAFSVASENQASVTSMFEMLFYFLAGAKDLCQLLPLKIIELSMLRSCKYI